MEIDVGPYTETFSKTVSFNPSIISESKRIIKGIATSPIYDRENELITQDAVAKALEDFMELPVITVDHLEYPVGIVTKAEFDGNGRLVVEAKIKKAKSCDAVWNKVRSGELNSFSIAGRRTQSTCTGDGRACVTKGLHINAITLCGDNRCNPDAVLTDVAVLEKSEPLDNNMTEEVVEAVNVESKLDALTDIVKALAETVAKAAEKDDKKAEEFKTEKNVEKCDDKPDKDENEALTKTVAELTEVVKAMEARITAMENRPIEKAVVTIGDDGAPITPRESYAKWIINH